MTIKAQTDSEQSDIDRSFTVSVVNRTGIGSVHIFASAAEAFPAIEQALGLPRTRTITVVALDREESAPLLKGSRS